MRPEECFRVGAIPMDAERNRIRELLSAPCVIESCGSGAGASAAAALNHFSGGTERF